MEAINTSAGDSREELHESKDILDYLVTNLVQTGSSTMSTSDELLNDSSESMNSILTQSCAQFDSHRAAHSSTDTTANTSTYELACLQGLKFDYDVDEVVTRERQSYKPSPESREMHNKKERQRRLRMKSSLDCLREIVPGMSPKTDKATVLEATVEYVVYLYECVRQLQQQNEAKQRRN